VSHTAIRQDTTSQAFRGYLALAGARHKPQQKGTTMSAPNLSQSSSSADHAGTTSVAGYLLRRLTEAGVRSVFGVTGDHNGGLIAAIDGNREMTWIPMATEAGAANAASMYARLRGIGATVTSPGAGEPIPPAYSGWTAAEPAPVVHIAGTPAHAASSRRRTARRGAETSVIAADVDLQPGRVVAEIDRVLHIALSTRRPVSITIAADLAGAPMLAAARRVRPTCHHDAGLGADGFAVQAIRQLTAMSSAGLHAIPSGPLSRPSMWMALADSLVPGDLVLADLEAAITGAAGLALPDGARLITQPIWASADWALPSALGASLAAPDRRVIVLAGDSALRQGSAELGALLAHGVSPIFIARAPARETAPTFAHMLRAAAVHGESPVVLRASTPASLARALTGASNTARPALIEISLEPGDSRTEQREPAGAAV
jgi:TPP-dependent 2-oxoacid decarboxylase